MATEQLAPRAIFLDRDGVINRRVVDGGYVRSWAEFEFLPGAIPALAELSRQGAQLIVVTNQRGVARGILARAALDDIHQRMTAVLARNGVHLGGIYVCPHEVGTCACRKPAPGLFRQAQRDYPSLDLSASDIVGDSLSDLQAGRALGMRLWLVGAPEERAPVTANAATLGIYLNGSADSLADLVQSGALAPLGIAA